MSNLAGSGPSRLGVRAVVKWFNTTKGYGFVRPIDSTDDAFLHMSVLQALGRADLPEGTEVVCDLVEGRKGLQVASISEVVSSPDVPPVRDGGYGGGDMGFGESEGPTLDGTVKFFNAAKGFGFIVPDDGSQDVFVSARMLERLNVPSLQPQQRVRVTTRQGPKGLMADSLELL